MIPRSLQMQTHEAVSGGGIPGSQTLVAGNEAIGWYGEVPASEFMNTAQLREVLGGTPGTPTTGTTNEPWLKFSYENKILFVAKRPLLHTISWVQMNELGIVAGKEIVHNGVRYKVRLIRAVVSPVGAPQIANSEWNNLMYRVCNTQTLTPRFAAYTIAQLGVNWANNVGSWTVCQEAPAGKMYLRGGGNITAAGYNDATTLSGNFYGWRPVLEVV